MFTLGQSLIIGECKILWYRFRHAIQSNHLNLESGEWSWGFVRGVATALLAQFLQLCA